ncbi:unnamed protein product [Protopolystoma xenopodis]|uniref:Uncharacterized protein n=1 Tax=Protopolystoma xenopodis TaxID=117903 RepID=A0A448XB11_9PLAT|nr:unnamed protein product [Protopolystoma xenopodis]
MAPVPRWLLPHHQHIITSANTVEKPGSSAHDDKSVRVRQESIQRFGPLSVTTDLGLVGQLASLAPQLIFVLQVRLWCPGDWAPLPPLDRPTRPQVTHLSKGLGSGAKVSPSEVGAGGKRLVVATSRLREEREREPHDSVSSYTDDTARPA